MRRSPSRQASRRWRHQPLLRAIQRQSGGPPLARRPRRLSATYVRARHLRLMVCLRRLRLLPSSARRLQLLMTDPICVLLAQAGESIFRTRRGARAIGTGLSTNGFTCRLMDPVNTSGSTHCAAGSSSSWRGVVKTVAGSLTQTCPTGGRIDKLMETSTRHPLARRSQRSPADVCSWWRHPTLLRPFSASSVRLILWNIELGQCLFACKSP